MVAWRYFRAKKEEKMISFIAACSLFGVMIGVAALIIVMAVMNGFHHELTHNIIGLDGEIVVRARYSGEITNYRQCITELSQQPFAKNVVPVAEGQALVTVSGAATGALVKGMNYADIKQTKSKILDNLLTSDAETALQGNNVLIGQQLAATLGLRLGDKVRLVSATTIPTVLGSLPRAKDFTVAGIFSSGIYDYDAAAVLMNIEMATKFLGLSPNSVNTIEMYTPVPDHADYYATLINTHCDQELRAVSWQQKYENFLHALKIERVSMFLILTLIIIVAAFNIVSSLLILVKDKIGDIAILKTIGATSPTIMMVFVFYGMIIGLSGTGIGLIIGLVFASNIDGIKKLFEQLSGIKVFDSAIYFLDYLPSKLVYGDVLSIVCTALGLCLLASLYPAYKASQLSPIEALRYE